MIKYFFGLQGSGKTTLAVAIAIKALKAGRYSKVYSNFPIDYPGIYLIQNDWIGTYDMSDSLILIDEATLYADNRDYAKFGKARTQFFMLHRHYHCDVFLFAQGYNAVDKKIRSITDRLYWVYKPRFLFRGITKAVRVPYGLGFTSDDDEEYGDITEGYKKPNILRRIFAQRCIRRKWYKYFDSWDAPPLPPIPW